MPVVWSGYDMINPLSHYATAYSCGGSYPGWNCDPAMPDLVAKFEVEADPGPHQLIAELSAADWVLVDGGDVIVHIFRPEVREFYNLEKMWAAEFAADMH